jgi:nucleoside 2-deoxyribosyltransferase
MTKVYLIGSLRNPRVQVIAAILRIGGYEVFDDWFAAGEKADDSWKFYEQQRERTYKEALYGHAATHVFEFDLHHLQDSDVAVLVLPAGKSGHLELGYMAGMGRPTFILFDEEPEWRWDVMYRFATRVVFTPDELMAELKKVP